MVVGCCGDDCRVPVRRDRLIDGAIDEDDMLVGKACVRHGPLLLRNLSLPVLRSHRWIVAGVVFSVD